MKNICRTPLLSLGRSSALFVVPLMVTLSLVLSSLSPFVAAISAADSAKTCMADKNQDSIDIGKYFGSVLTQVRKDWRKDAQISSLRIDDRLGKNFDALCKLNIFSAWTLVLYSPSLRVEQVAYLDGERRSDSGIALILYNVKRIEAGNTAFQKMTVSEMMAERGWTFDSYPLPEMTTRERKGSANPFRKWKMTLSGVVQKFLDRTRSEAITAYGWSINIGKVSPKTGTVYAEIYWQNGAKKQSYFVNPITQKSYLVRY